MAGVGKRRRRVTIRYYAAAVQNATTGSWDVPTYSDVATVWAHRTERNSQRGQANHAQHFQNSYTYEIDYNSSLTFNTHTMLYDVGDAKLFTIESAVLNNDIKRKYRLQVSEKSNA